MKKIFKKFSGIIFVFFMLFSIAFIDVEKNTGVVEESEAAYVVANDPKYINSLISSNIELEAEYNLSDYYPMVNENQKDSSFCWMYASMKSLESALMIQKNEYYNFSEIGLAYLDYVDRVERIGTTERFNLGGNFIDFYKAYQDHGLVLESDFSNDNYSGINSSTYRDYIYVKDMATKELNSAIKPFMLGTEMSTMGVDNSAKIKLVKKFVKTYGGMFAGIEGVAADGGSVGKGCFYSNNTPNKANVSKFYSVNRGPHMGNGSSNKYQPLDEYHAITIIGWDDNVYIGPQENGAFLVMNSWGFDEATSIRLFYVPYSYSYMISSCSGFICDEEPESISIESASESRFTIDILKGENDIDNAFCYDDEIWVNYKLDLTSLDNVDVKITSGNKNFNGIFSITSDNATKTVKVKLNNRAAFYGGYYSVSFYNGSVLLGKRSIFIYSGTEQNYFKASSSLSFDSYALDNAFLSANNIATFNVPSIKNGGGGNVFTLEFNRSPISSQTFVSLSNKASQIKSFSMEISDVQIICSGNRDIEDDYTQEKLIDELFSYEIAEYGNLFKLKIGRESGSELKLEQFENCLIRFRLSINSSVYADCEREYIFNLFISDRYSANTSNLFSIFYELNGGENNEDNLTKYPRYNQIIPGDMVYDPNMTTLELAKPTKVGSVFVGWFLEKTFINQVTQIDSNLQGNITLYAKWESLGTDYFDINLSLESAKDYNDNAKTLPTTLMYGDSISIRFDFIKKQPLEYNEYTVQYFFFGVEIVEDYLNTLDTYKIFELNFPKLKSGNHLFSIKTKVRINGILEIVEESYISVYVDKKPVVFGFDNLVKTYNGKEQKPEVVMVEDFYAEDFENINKNELFNLACNVESKTVGKYNFYISSLNNNNYSFDQNSETSKCVFEITKRGITLNWKEYNQVYDGNNHLPEYEVVNIVAGDEVEFLITVLEYNGVAQHGSAECKNAGSYKVNISTSSITNKNYTISDVSDFVFEIKKSKIKIIMHSTSDRVQIKSEKRNIPEYSIVGVYLSVEDLKLNIITEALLATKSGKYTISCSVENQNYELEVVKATYTLTGYYNVYYQLSNGKTYTERVEEGKDPVGVTKKELGVSKFSKVDYSDDYLITGDDIYVEVEYKDYSFAVYSGIFASVGAIIGFVIYLKKRGSSVR